MNDRVNIEINHHDFPNRLENSITQAVNLTLTFISKGQQVEITVLICDDEYMRKLNLTYRGLDKTTDVLSFEDSFEIPGSNATYMGDIAISYPTAVRQAEALGHTVDAEISLLAVHGVLHLFGFDHQDAQQKEAMWAVQSKIMTTLGFPNIATVADGYDV